MLGSSQCRYGIVEEPQGFDPAIVRCRALFSMPFECLDDMFTKRPIGHERCQHQLMPSRGTK